MASIYIQTSKDSETGKKVTALIKKGKEITHKTRTLLRELGVFSEYVSSGECIFGTGIEAVKFEQEPDMKIWKIKHFKELSGTYYAPRLGNKKGKEIQNKIESFGHIYRSELDKCIGINNFFNNCGFNEKEDCYVFHADSDWNVEIPNDCVEITYSQFEN